MSVGEGPGVAGCKDELVWLMLGMEDSPSELLSFQVGALLDKCSIRKHYCARSRANFTGGAAVELKKEVQ